MATSINAQGEIAELQALLEPLMWMEAYGSAFMGRGAFAAAFPPYTYDGYIKADDLGATTAAETRRALLARAEGILEALADAGWQPTEYPDMEFTGEIVEPFAQTIGGEIVRPSVQGGIRLRLRLAVDRSR